LTAVSVERFVDRFIENLRAITTVVVVITVAFLVYLATNGLRFDYNIENFLPADSPVIQEYRSFTDKYEPDDGIILLGFEHENVFQFEVLRDVAAISDSIEALESVDRVESLTTYRGLISTDQGLEFKTLIERIEPDAAVLAAQKDAVLADPLAPGYVVNETGTVTALFVRIAPEVTGYAGRREVIDRVENILEPYRASYRFRESGIPVLRNGYVDSIQRETFKYLILNSLVIAVVLFWLFRSLAGIFLPLIIVYAGGVWTVSVMNLSGSSIDVLSSTISAIILVVGIADYVHLQTKYNEIVRSGGNRREAVRGMVLRLGVATLLTSITTAIGFSTLATSNIIPMRRFGVYTAVGVLLTFVVSIVLVSAVQWIAPPPSQATRPGSGRRFQQHLDRVDGWTSRYPKSILLGAGVVLLASVFGATRLRVNSYINDDLGPRTELYRDMAFFQEKLAAPFPLEILLTSDAPGAFKDPDLLRKVRAVQSHLNGLPSVGRTVSIVDLLLHLHERLGADDSSEIPDSPELIAQYLLLLEISNGGDTNRLTDFDYSEVRISALMDDVGSRRLNPILAGVDSVIAAVFVNDPVSASKSGTIVIAASVSQSITRSLLVSIALAFVFISLIMAVAFRDMKYIVISLIPNVIPLVVTAGFMGFVGIAIKPATAVIFSIAFGIAVDDSIHFLARFRQELRDRSLEDALRTTLRETGRAIVMTSVIVVAGFLSLGTSRFETTAYMGYLVSITVVVALLADLLVLPALIRIWIKPRELRRE
jgi:predicted RND superfamily exporter protein